MKRSLDNMLEISGASYSSQKQDQYPNLSSVYENDRIYYDATERQKIVTNWISDYDPLLLSTNQLYGREGKAIGNSVVGLLSSKDCRSYYTFNLLQKEADIKLCQYICPVFVLHGIATMLQQAPLHNGHISYYWQFVLHLLKNKLVVTGKSIGTFISRLFDLVYADGFTPYEIPEIYINIITIFLHENLHFMNRQEPLEFGASHYYTLSAEDIEKPGSITDIVTNSIFPVYFITTVSHMESIATSGLASQNDAIALWNKYQLDRGTMREMQLFTGNICPIPEKKKKKTREALKNVQFNDVVDTFHYRSYKK